MTDMVGYTPGEAWLISGSGAMVMTDGDAAGARRYWNLVRRNATAAELIEGISPGPVAGALAVLVWEPAGVRVLVRGAAVVRARPVGGTWSEVTATSLLTWREELLVEVAEVEVVAEHDLPCPTPEDADLLPVPAGVVRAAFARRRTDDQPTAAESSVPGAEPAASVDPTPEPPREPEPERYVDPAPAPAPAPEPAPAPHSGAAQVDAPAASVGAADPVVENVVGDDAVTVISMVPASARDLPAPRTAPVPDPFAEDADEAEPVSGFTSDEAPATPEATPPTPPTPSTPLTSASTDGDRADEAARHRAPDVTQSVPLDYEEDPILDRVPSVEPPRTAPPETTEQAPAPDLLPGPPEPGRPEPMLGDHDGITELAEDLPAGFTPPPLPPPLVAGWVYASLCPSGHANQPHAGNCRICGQPIPPGDPVAAPQPLLGRLRFSTGELVDLDRRVIIGRAPSVSRVSSSELPRLVTVPSPQQDISRSHAEVRIEDWHVVVADLHSTNGTVLRAPDRPEQLLHPGQEMVIEPGWTVDLGDGVTVAVEAAG